MILRIVLVLVLNVVVGCLPTLAEDADVERGAAAFRANNYAEARQIWSKAASAGDAIAMNNLGYMLFEGIGGSKDVEAALDLWSKAAAMGNSESQLFLGVMYEQGMIRQQDRVQAYAWYQCAVANSRAQAVRDKRQASVLHRASASVERLEHSFSKKELVAAKETAGKYMAQYVRH
jgi:TPR repeat protein